MASNEPIHAPELAGAVGWLVTQLAREFTPLRQRLARLPSFPPATPPDSGTAFRAALGLLALQRASHAPLPLQPEFAERVLAPVMALIAALPNLAWPARVFLEAAAAGDPGSLPVLRQIAQRVLDGTYALKPFGVADLILRLVVPLLSSSADQPLALNLYERL